MDFICSSTTVQSLLPFSTGKGQIYHSNTVLLFLLLHLHDWTIFHSSLFFPSASTFLNNVATNGKFGFHPPTTIDSLPASLSKPMKFNSNLCTILGTSLNYIRRQIVFKRIWHTFEVINYQRIPSLKINVRDPIGYRGAEPTTNNCT